MTMSQTKPTFARRSDADHDRIKAFVGVVDELASNMERKWGVDRLPRLVPEDYAERFYRQAKKFDAALAVGSPADVEYEAERMRNAWIALDAVATEAKAEPISVDVWEVPVGDGRVVALVRSREEQFVLAREGRYMEIYSAQEIANLIKALPDISKFKQAFPGSEVVDVRVSPIDWGVGDELPEDWQANPVAAI